MGTTSPATRTDATATADIDIVQIDSPLEVTDSAALKMRELLQGQEAEGLAVRVAAQPGGCSGLQYQMFFDSDSHPGDLKMSFGDVSVVIDEQSVPHMHGTVIDFVETTDKQGFTIENPSSSGGGGGGSCGCNC